MRCPVGVALSHVLPLLIFFHIIIIYEIRVKYMNLKIYNEIFNF